MQDALTVTPTPDIRSRLATLQDPVASFVALLSAADAGVVLQDAEGRIKAASARAQEILGLDEAQLLGVTSVDPSWRTVRRDGSPFAGEDHPAMVALRTGMPVRGVAMGVHRPDGSLRWIAINAEPVRDAAGTLLGVVTCFYDHTERLETEFQVRELMDRLGTQALADPLTGLPNRRAFDARLTEEIARVRRRGGAMSLAVIDVDGFKTLNDSRGHPAGDLALVRLAAILRTAVRQEDVATRLGGDEFAVILPGIEVQDARAVIERVRGDVAADRTLVELGITLSAGVAELGAAGTSADVYRRADAALYAAKAAGGDGTATDR